VSGEALPSVTGPEFLSDDENLPSPSAGENRRTEPPGARIWSFGFDVAGNTRFPGIQPIL
jgi:hypothetical protein